MIGKIIGTFRYVHVYYYWLFLTDDQIKILTRYLPDWLSQFTVLKINHCDHDKISLINCPNFDLDAEPVVTNSLVFDFKTRTGKERRLGTQVYHHKYLMVDRYYSGFDYEKAKQRSIEISGWTYEKNKSGSLANWIDTCKGCGDWISNSYLKEDSELTN